MRVLQKLTFLQNVISKLTQQLSASVCLSVKWGEITVGISEVCCDCKQDDSKEEMILGRLCGIEVPHILRILATRIAINNIC